MLVGMLHLLYCYWSLYKNFLGHSFRHVVVFSTTPAARHRNESMKQAQMYESSRFFTPWPCSRVEVLFFSLVSNPSFLLFFQVSLVDPVLVVYFVVNSFNEIFLQGPMFLVVWCYNKFVCKIMYMYMRSACCRRTTRCWRAGGRATTLTIDWKVVLEREEASR